MAGDNGKLQCGEMVMTTISSPRFIEISFLPSAVGDLIVSDMNNSGSITDVAIRSEFSLAAVGGDGVFKR